MVVDNKKDESVLRKALTNYRLGHWFVDCRDRAVKAAQRDAAKKVEEEIAEREMAAAPTINVTHPDEDGKEDDAQIEVVEAEDGQEFEEEVVADPGVLPDRGGQSGEDAEGEDDGQNVVEVGDEEEGNDAEDNQVAIEGAANGEDMYDHPEVDNEGERFEEEEYDGEEQSEEDDEEDVPDLEEPGEDAEPSVEDDDEPREDNQPDIVMLDD